MDFARVDFHHFLFQEVDQHVNVSVFDFCSWKHSKGFLLVHLHIAIVEHLVISYDKSVDP